MDGEEDRNQQDRERQREEPAVPGSFDSRRAAKPTATNKTTTRRLAMLNRKRLMGRTPKDWNHQPAAILNQSCAGENRHAEGS